MKKLLSAILSISILAASAAVPVMAEYTSKEYDSVAVNKTFENSSEVPEGASTVTNDIDNSTAIQAGETFVSKIFYDGNLDTTKEFLMSFDFRFDNSDAVNADNKYDAALIEIPKYKSSGVDKTGPRLRFSDDKTKLVTETSGTPQELGAITINTWYTAEIEGKTGIGKQYTTFRLYGYNSEGEKELIKETKDFDMRNISSENRSINGIGMKYASIDNVKLIKERPNKITISSDSDELSAGQALPMDYTMYRDDTEYTKYPVTWSVNGNGVSIGTDGALVAGISAENQTVTVTASVEFDGKTLTGTKDITIKAVDTSDEKFDTITISGSDSVKAGAETTYTVAATKSGAPVTLADGDVVWSLYDFGNINPYYDSSYANTKAISVENGVLKIADGVVPQAVTIRASSKSGQVYGSKKVDIVFSESQVETVVYSTAFESTLEGTNKTVSVDGSIAYKATAEYKAWDVKDQEGYTVTNLDIKFTQNGAGFVLMRRDGGKWNTEIQYNNGVLKTQNGSTLLDGASTDKWYHIEVLYSSTDASCKIYPYNDDGTLGEGTACIGIDRRNAAAYGRLDIYTGACVDNIVISKPDADAVKVTAPSQNIFAGNSGTFACELSRNGLPMKGVSGVTWSVIGPNGSPLGSEDKTLTVDKDGKLTVSAAATAGVYKVRATYSGISGEAPITVMTMESFEVTNIGINEAGDKIVRIYADMKLFYTEDVTFIIAIKDSNGVLKAVRFVKTFGDRLKLGENEITTDFDLPADFDSATDNVEVLVWTTL